MIQSGVKRCRSIPTLHLIMCREAWTRVKRSFDEACLPSCMELHLCTRQFRGSWGLYVSFVGGMIGSDIALDLMKLQMLCQDLIIHSHYSFCSS